MDDRLQKALEHGKYKLALKQAKENLLLRFFNDITFAHNGGTFKATPDFLTFVEMLSRQLSVNAVIMDVNNNPIEITDIEQFKNLAIFRYHEATNAYYTKFSALKRARSVQAVTEIA